MDICKMPMCYDCDRWFSTDTGYRQHLENSSAHKYDDYTSPSEEDEDYYLSSEEEEILPWTCTVCPRSFGSEHALHQHCRDAGGHPYCADCKRMFNREHDLTQHLRSRRHMGSSITCPWCKNDFTTAGGLTIHLESGTCSSGIDRRLINETISKYDRHHRITTPLLLAGTASGKVDVTATEYAWNGNGYQCYLCPKEFLKLYYLNQHLRSAAHDLEIYRCPKHGCPRTYKLLSALVQHVESESCGLMKFHQVQRAAKGGLENMIGKMVRAA